MPHVTLNPVEPLRGYGLSITTIARIAQVRVPVLRAWTRNGFPESDPALIRLRGALSLLDNFYNMLTLPVDAATFYDEQIILMERKGKKFYCHASYLYESGLWKQEDFINYAESATFYSPQDFMKDFPLVTTVVDTHDGHKAILCEYPISRLDFIPPSLAEFTVIN